MIIHCTKCHHEWEAMIMDPCYSCGVERTEDITTHTDECVVMNCDWCKAPGKVLCDRTADLPSMAEVMEDLAKIYRKREWEDKDAGGTGESATSREEEPGEV